jgi:hypothetical protein
MRRTGFKANLSGWKPRVFPELKLARVQLVPFPVIFVLKVLFWERANVQ